MRKRHGRMLSANVAAPNFKHPPPLAIPKYNNVMQGVDRHDQLRSRFALASRHGFKKYYITHQLAQLDMGITHAGILQFEAHPELKNKEGQQRKFNKSIANYFIKAMLISWEALYGNSILDLDSQTPGNESDDDDNIMHQLGVLNMVSDPISPMKAVVDVCNPCSPFDKKFMDNHKIKYLKNKGVDSVELKVLKSHLGRRLKNCQLCDFEGRGMVTSQTCYLKVHCVWICMKQHQDSMKIGLKRTDSTEPVTDFSWLCPDNNLSCWQKFHLWY
jgi:hypothetical protein